MTHGVVGLCLAPVDLAISKLAASREKDLAFVRVMAEHNLFDRAEFDALIRTLPETARKTINHALQVLKLGNDC